MINFDEFEQVLALHRNAHAGYPYNLNNDPSALLSFLRYRFNNLGDPDTSSGYRIDSKAFEQSCLQWFAQLYDLEDHWGYVTTSETEGNFYGVLLGRERYPDAVLYSSKDAHYSIAKAARLFQVPHTQIDAQHSGEIDYEHLEFHLKQNRHLPAILSLSLGTPFKGAVDRIDRVIEILQRLEIRQFHIHCDASLGGLLLPFIEGAPKISFRYPIDSISVSGHEFLGSPIPCGVVLTRQEHASRLAYNVEDIGKDSTLLGSRCGLAPLFLWHAISTRKERFHQEVSACLLNAHYLHNRLGEIAYPSVLNEFSTTVVLFRPDREICRKWQLSTRGLLARLVVMQNVSAQKIDTFIHELQEKRHEQSHAATGAGSGVGSGGAGSDLEPYWDAYGLSQLS